MHQEVEILIRFYVTAWPVLPQNGILTKACRFLIGIKNPMEIFGALFADNFQVISIKDASPIILWLPKKYPTFKKKKKKKKIEF